MGLPQILKDFNLFGDGDSYQGLVKEINHPKLKRKMEDYRAGGMGGPIKLDLGMEGLQMTWTCGGFMRAVLAQFGALKHNGVQLRFAGAYQSDSSDTPDSVEIVVLGRHSEIDIGDAKAGEKSDFKVVTEISYYKLSINGETLIEIDFINKIEFVNGEDKMAAIRAAIGL